MMAIIEDDTCLVQQLSPTTFSNQIENEHFPNSKYILGKY